MRFERYKSSRKDEDGNDTWHKIRYYDRETFRDALEWARSDERDCRGYWYFGAETLWIEREDVALEVLLRFPAKDYYVPAPKKNDS